jgi:hypothetical protein
MDIEIELLIRDGYSIEKQQSMISFTEEHKN